MIVQIYFLLHKSPYFHSELWENFFFLQSYVISLIVKTFERSRLFAIDALIFDLKYNAKYFILLSEKALDYKKDDRYSFRIETVKTTWWFSAELC